MDSRLPRLRAFLALRARTWVYLVPLHLIAFLALYMGAYRVMVSEITTATGDAARLVLEHEIDELSVTVPGQDGRESAHYFDEFIAVHRSMQLRLFNAEGVLVAGDFEGSTDVGEAVQSFLAQDVPESVSLESKRDQSSLRLIQRLVARDECGGCHEPGQLLGAFSLNLDLTGPMQRAQSSLFWSLALLLFVWMLLVAIVSVFLVRSVERSVTHLEADLAAAEAGKTAPSSAALDLDPVSAPLHRSLRTFLQRARAREAVVATRMEHTDQLATLGRLAVGLAHEIKNPLAGIHGALQILHEDVVDESAKNICNQMQQELARVNQTLKLLLESARPSPTRLEKTAVQTLLKEILGLHAPSLRRRNITLETEIAPDLESVRLDRAKMRQVLVNLIGNAADAVGENGRITIKAIRFPENDGIILAVQDDGPGIPEQDQGMIFDPFFTTKTDGTGLGLSIAHSLVQQHGGTLEVNSEPEQGTTFLILLPDTTDNGSEIE
jgi:signal transduction histidine kinase